VLYVVGAIDFETNWRHTKLNDEARGPDPFAVAMEWVTKITTVGLEMVLPAIGGAYLDKRIGTTYWALIGVVLGMTVGMWHLLQMTRKRNGDSKNGETGNGKRTPGGSSRQ
jgi:hypothetical protein